MSSINLTGVSFIAPAPVNQHVNIYYRLTSDPDVPVSYTTAAINVEVLVSGLFVAPVVISGLDPLTSYTVWIENICGGFFKKVFVTGEQCSICLDTCCIKLNNCSVKF